MSKTSHSNIVKSLQIITDQYFHHLALELCHRNLDEMVLSNTIGDYSVKVKLLYDIASSLDHLHSKGIVHRDLKPTNILIKINNVGIKPKIVDFGISRIMAYGKDHYTATNGGLGTPGWCPPEVLDDENEHITTAVDMFAFGLILHFIMCPGTKPQLRHPFRSLKSNIFGENIINAIKTGKRFSYISTLAYHYQMPMPIDKIKRLFSDILIQLNKISLMWTRKTIYKTCIKLPSFLGCSEATSLFKRSAGLFVCSS